MKKLLAIFFVAMSLISCRDAIELDLPDNDPLLVVNGVITDTIPVQVQVLTSAPYFSGETPGVSDATVLVFENGIQIDSLIESDTAAGYYYGSTVGYVGGVYSIEVQIGSNNAQFESGTWVSVEEELKRCPPIDSFYSEYREGSLFQPEGYYVAAHFHEAAGKGDYYRIRAWRNDSLLNTPFDLQYFSDEFADGLNYNNDPLPAFTLDGPKPVGTTYKIELGGITPEYFDFLDILRQQTAQVGGTFDPPPAAIIGNIHRKGDPSDYALGYFNATKVNYAETVIVQ